MDPKHKATLVKVAFDSGQTHEYKGASLLPDRLRVVRAARRDCDSHASVVLAIGPDAAASAAPAPAPRARASLRARLGSRDAAGATPDPPP